MVNINDCANILDYGESFNEKNYLYIVTEFCEVTYSIKAFLSRKYLVSNEYKIQIEWKSKKLSK